MQLHQLQPAHAGKKKKRIGRGGKRGTYSGRGMKGQKSRTGTNKFQPVVRQFVKRYPKVRGYKVSGKPKDATVFNVRDLEKRFAVNDVVSPETLQVQGKVKILGTGELTKALRVEMCMVSKTAQTKIEKAGGTIT
jgi:large subunit ribosomal protein L15